MFCSGCPIGLSGPSIGDKGLFLKNSWCKFSWYLPGMDFLTNAKLKSSPRHPVQTGAGGLHSNAPCHNTNKQGVCHTVALPFTLRSILRQKNTYGNSNISPCKNIIFKKTLYKKPKILQDIITLELISSFNTSQNIIFQKSSYQSRPIIT